jgi:hypothetical protein
MEPEQILKVKSSDIDTDWQGNQLSLYYILFDGVVSENTGLLEFELYMNDQYGNGPRICIFDNRTRAISTTLKLGEFVEWKTSK